MKGAEVTLTPLTRLVVQLQYMTMNEPLQFNRWKKAWVLLIAVQYRDALIRRRQEAIATAALEALTRNSVLHRRDVKTLIRENRKDKNEKNNPQQ